MDAETLVYQTYVRAFSGAAFPGPEMNLRVWLMRHLRAIWRTNGRTPPERIHRGASSPTAVDGPAHHQDLSTAGIEPDDTRIRAAVDALPVTLRETVWLRDVVGCSYTELVDILEVPSATVKANLSKARRLLAERLGVAAPQPLVITRQDSWVTLSRTI